MSGYIILLLMGVSFLFGFLGGAFVTYEIKEKQIETQQLAYQKSVTQAQSKAMEKELQGQTITQEITNEYEKKIAALNANANFVISSLSAKNSSANRLPEVPHPSQRINDSSCKLDKVRLASLQKWIKLEVAEYNK